MVWLESGNRVPADVRLLETTGLEIDESLLTGESLAVRKNPNWIGPEPASLGDRLNLAFAGSIVTRGRGKGLVVATGTATAVGQLALDVVGTVALSPLRSPTLFYGAIGAFLFHLAAMHIGFVRDVLETAPVSLTTWLVLVLLAVLIVPVIELHRWS